MCCKWGLVWMKEEERQEVRHILNGFQSTCSECHGDSGCIRYTTLLHPALSTTTFNESFIRGHYAVVHMLPCLVVLFYFFIFSCILILVFGFETKTWQLV